MQLLLIAVIGAAASAAVVSLSTPLLIRSGRWLQIKVQGPGQGHSPAGNRRVAGPVAHQ